MLHMRAIHYGALVPILISLISSVSAASLVPPSQSKCEIAANRFKAAHPHMDALGYVNAGVMFFGDASPPEILPPYRDSETGITFKVESDGRHLGAVDANGKVLWVRDPFVDNNLCPYRSAHPYISWIGAPGGGFGRRYLEPFKPVPDSKANPKIVQGLHAGVKMGIEKRIPKLNARFIGLGFNSSQVGYVDIANGDFYFMGQD